MVDFSSLWDFDDPAGSEQRLRDAAGKASGDDRLVLLTQVARALGLQERYAEGHAVLDELRPAESAMAAEVGTRRELERGRLFRSAGRPEESRAYFDAAVTTARSAGLDALLVDALHMVALVAAPEEQPGLLDQALEVCRSSRDPVARRWEASLLNNVGMTHADTGDFAAALVVFEQALAARRLTGPPAEVRIARWMVAWSLRNLDRASEALAIQRELKAELVATGENDPYIDEELALLTGADPS
jgi:tetratricopeptide (TPR) repeat protein